MPQVFEVGAVVLGAHHGVTDVFQQHQPVGRVFDNDVVELSGTAQAPDNPHRNLKRLLHVGRLLSKLSCRNLNVLFRKRVDHVGGRQIAGCQPDGVEPDAHGVLALTKNHHVAHAGNALDRVFDVDIKVVREKLGRVAAVVGVEAGAEDKVEVRLGDGDAA